MPLGLYLHFPFCKNHCSYCDFYKVLYNQSLEQRFYETLTIETELAAKALGGSKPNVSTIFIGGGTPSMTDLSLLQNWFNQVRDLFRIPKGIEFSIECNPESIDIDKLAAFKEIGINRPTFGVQSFNKKALALMDRRHAPFHVHRAIYSANALDIKNYGVDLLFGLPNQNSPKFVSDIEQLIDLGAPHISFYQLTVEPETKLLDNVQSGKIRLPDPDLMHALYRIGVEKMAKAGYHRYEVSSFAKPGHECQHNLNYWNGTDYLGLGPSAHSLIDGKRFANLSNLTEYVNKLKQHSLPRVEDISDKTDRANEAIMLCLRTSAGINLRKFTRRFGFPVKERLDKKQYELLIESGHLVAEKGILRLSDEGIYQVDEIARRLII